MSTPATVTWLNRQRPDPVAAAWTAIPRPFWQAWAARRRYRRELRRLLRLGVHLVEDIGLPVAAALSEAEKPFWRA